MKKWLIIAGIVLLTFAVTVGMMAFGGMGGFSKPQTSEQTARELAALLESTVAKDDSLHNGILKIDAPQLGVVETFATGVANATTSAPMVADTPFLSASIGKLFTAVTIQLLAQEGVLSLDDSITQWLPAETYSGIPVEGGDAVLDQVTIRMLLAQRSGIPDYFEAETVDGAPNVLSMLETDPDHSWTPETLLAYTKKHYEAAGAPGTTFHYSDTNYNLLGMIIEEATGQPFHEVVEERILEPLGLDKTWYHAYTNPDRTGDPDPGEAVYADVFIGEHNLRGAPALSLDWAGGGLATTTDDLGAFMRSLLNAEPVALDTLQVEYYENALNSGIDYGYGLWRIRPSGIIFLLRGYPDLYGASGSTGTYLYYIPEYDAIISGAFNQIDYQQKHIQFLIKVLDTLGKIETPAD